MLASLITLPDGNSHSLLSLIPTDSNQRFTTGMTIQAGANSLFLGDSAIQPIELSTGSILQFR